jgi:hypothetical protein
MNDPRLSAAFGALAAVYFGYNIFAASEVPSTALSTLNWTFFLLGVFALAGSLYRIASGK